MPKAAPSLAIAHVTMGLYDCHRHLVATARHGSVSGRPIHAAACTTLGCHSVIRDHRSFERSVRWLRRHLVTHNIDPATIRLALGPQRHRPEHWWRQAEVAVGIVERVFCVGPNTHRRTS
jgi:hypothetical protein